ncbi:MAG: molybdopterin oxidoreductase family protein, partial [Opitutaceae bacterium]|nr:molybdopterin oxidoreductase family protein [Opitutaceae bacterium]
RILDIPVERIPSTPSKAYDQIIDGIEAGDIRALWIIATNTAHSWIDQSRFARLRQNLDFLVVQDMYATTESARMADLVLPAAGWGEKEGFFINSERRLGRIRKVSRAPGEALSDFAIFKLIAESWGCGDLFRRWSTPASAFQIIKELSAGRPCDITGIRDLDHLESAGGIQWPYPASDSQLSTLNSQPSANQRRLFADGQFFTPDKRAKFFFDEPRAMPEPPTAEYPFLLNTGRGSSAQWHTGSRTNKSDVLRKLAPTSLYVEINPLDATRLNIANNAPVTVHSRRGEAEASAVITTTVQPGQLFMPMHFEAVNRLTFPSFDPHSRQPSYKACAVRLTKM